MHGNTRNGTAPPEYWVRANMLRRCLDPQHPQYRLYGARGISVDEAWQQSYSNFIQDMGPRPSIKHSIERVDNNKGYSKSNCIWATSKTQVLNRNLKGTKSTGVVGVKKINSKFVARIKVNYIEIRLGTYTTLEEAFKARQQAVAQYFGEQYVKQLPKDVINAA